MRPQILVEWLDSERLTLDSVSIKPCEDDNVLYDVVQRDETQRVESAWLVLDWPGVYRYLSAQVASHKLNKNKYAVSIDGFSPMTQSAKAFHQERIQDIVSECMEIWRSSWIQVPA